MLSQLPEEELAAEPFHSFTTISWKTLENTYVCRAAVREEENGKFSAVAIRRQDISAEGSSKEDALSRLQDAYKQAVLTSGPSLKPIKEMANSELWEAINCTIEVEDSELRKVIAARIPSDEDLALIACDSEPSE